MAEDKKSFVLYSDYKELFSELSDKDAGQLIKHILAYVNDENPISTNAIVKVSFIPIKLQLKRDLKKYESKKEQWSDAGKKSAEARRLKKEQEEQEANERSTESTDVKTVATDSTVTVTDTVNVTVINKKEKNADAFNIFWSKYPNKVAKDKCKDKFVSLSQTDIDKILTTLDGYLLYKPFEDYRHPNPETYINQKRWNDEIPTVVKHKTNEDLYAEHVMKQIRANS